MNSDGNVNVNVNEFDMYIKQELRAKYYIRYADDFVFLHTDKLILENYLRDVHIFLGEYLKLTLHPKKVSITTLASGVDFLGWVHFPKHRTLRTVTKRRMFKKLKQKEYKVNFDVEGKEGTLGYAEESVQSYLGMLKHGNGHKLSEKILKKK